MPPFRRDGTCAARIATGSPRGFAETSGSNMSRMMKLSIVVEERIGLSDLASCGTETRSVSRFAAPAVVFRLHAASAAAAKTAQMTRPILCFIAGVFAARDVLRCRETLCA